MKFSSLSFAFPRLSLAGVTIALLATGIAGSQETGSAQSGVDVVSQEQLANGRTPFVHLKNLPTFVKIVPKLPLVEGCYVYRGSWQRTKCATSSQNSAYPHLEYLPAAALEPAAEGGNIPPMPVTGGNVDVSFARLGGITDSQFCSDHWSIQANTNCYAGNNHQIDWTQFTDQHIPNWADHLCIGNVASLYTAHPQYGSTCYDVGVGREPRTGDVASIEAYGDFSRTHPADHYLVLRAYLSWDSQTQMYGVVVDDKYGLTSSVRKGTAWHEVFGSVLGFGNGSTANFSDSKLEIAVGTLDCTWETGTGCAADPRPQAWAGTDAHSKLSAIAAEENNLRDAVDYNTSTTSFPSLHCLFDYACYLDYTAWTD